MDRMLRWLVVVAAVLLLTNQADAQNWKESGLDTSHVHRTRQLRTSDFFSSPSQPLHNSTQSPPATQMPLTGRETTRLPVFGFDLFSSEGADFATQSSEALSLPSSYQLGPGDRVGIYLLGSVQENIDVMVNVEGKIFLPPGGVIYVWGLGMDEFRTLLTQKLSQYYDNFTLDIMLLQPKNVMVAVVGDVIRPGKYVLSALNTVLDAVILAGGPTGKGSIRDIRLMRNGELFTSVDLYRFLMSGENSEDEFLQASDRIFVPIAQHKVKVTGEVNRPAIFELKPDLHEKLSDVIELAGGFTDFAFPDRIELSRLGQDGYRTVHYIDFSQIAAGDSTQDILLRNEDEVHVYSKLEQIHERRVAIFGEIRRPGAYVLEDNMHLSDLILKAGNLTRKAYLLEAEVAKVDPGKPTQFMKVNLDKLANNHSGSNGNHRSSNGSNGHHDILLEEDDQVFIRQIPEWEVGLMVEVQGEVVFPGHYPIIKDSTFLSEILDKAGGFTDDAFPQEAFVMRASTRLKFDKEFERLKEMRREEMSDLEYQYFVMRQNSADIDRIVVDFEKLVYQKDRAQDIVLEDGDIIVVPRAPKVVTVTGSVAKPGGVTYLPGADLRYYLAKAGGASWDAKLSKTKVIKVTGEVLDDEEVSSFQAGDIVWVPRKSDRKFWPVALQTISVLAQLASIYLIIDTSIDR